MDDETLREWIELGQRLGIAGPRKLADMMRKLLDVVEAQEIIAQYDHQLFLRGGRRPTKRYLA